MPPKNRRSSQLGLPTVCWASAVSAIWPEKSDETVGAVRLSGGVSSRIVGAASVPSPPTVGASLTLAIVIAAVSVSLSAPPLPVAPLSFVTICTWSAPL